MDVTYANALVEMAASLASLAVKGTASIVNTKIKAIKDEKNIDKVRATYDEIINELISEREEAIRIAQAYKAELDRIEIDDEDIKHLHNTFRRLLELFKKMRPNDSTNMAAFEQIIELFNIDTLKAVQLLGFNYKAAIGQPLTQLCAEAILSMTNRGQKTGSRASGSRSTTVGKK